MRSVFRIFFRRGGNVEQAQNKNESNSKGNNSCHDMTESFLGTKINGAVISRIQFTTYYIFIISISDKEIIISVCLAFCFHDFRSSASGVPNLLKGRILLHNTEMLSFNRESYIRNQQSHECRHLQILV